MIVEQLNSIQNTKYMEKKKVKAMIEDAISRLAILHADEGDSCEHIIKILENALEELSKPDWISVKDKLPPYEKSVLVCNEKVSFPLLNGWACKSNNKRRNRHNSTPHTPKDVGIFAQ